MNDRQVAITISIFFHVVVLLLMGYFRFPYIAPPEILYEVALTPPPSPPPEQAPVQPPPRPVSPPSKSSLKPVQPPASEPALPPESAGKEPETRQPGPEKVTLSPEDSVKRWRGEMRGYFRDQFVIKFEGDWAAFMDYNAESLNAPRDTMEAIQRFLESRLAAMALTPEELAEVYQPGDLVGDQLKRNEGIIPMSPLGNVPIALLANAAAELAKKAIGVFKKSVKPHELLSNLSEDELRILATMWNLGWAPLPMIYKSLPRRISMNFSGLAFLFSQWKQLKFIQEQHKGEEKMYLPSLSRSDVMQYYLAQLGMISDNPANDTSETARKRRFLINKIAILNNIQIAGSSQ